LNGFAVEQNGVGGWCVLATWGIASVEWHGFGLGLIASEPDESQSIEIELDNVLELRDRVGEEYGIISIHEEREEAEVAVVVKNSGGSLLHCRGLKKARFSEDVVYGEYEQVR
jgi:hypothetical protein